MVMPAAAEEAFRSLSFSLGAHELRREESRHVKGPERRSFNPDARFLRALEFERATQRIERPVGIKGEGPALSLNSTSLRTLMADNYEMALGLLERYQPVYSAAFPDPDERLSFETVVELLQNPQLSLDLDVFTDTRGIVGGYQTLVAEINGEMFSLGDYLCVDNRSKGLGVAPLVYRNTIESRRENFGALAHFGEVNDPRVMDAAQQAIDRKSGTDPEARLKFWTNQGRRTVDAPWIQPATAEGLSPVDYMMLTVHHIDTTKHLHITGETIQEVWDAYYLPLVEMAPVLETRDTMVKLLAPYQGRQVDVLPLTTPRSCIDN